MQGWVSGQYEAWSYKKKKKEKDKKKRFYIYIKNPHKNNTTWYKTKTD